MTTNAATMAQWVDAIRRCDAANNTEWRDRHTDELLQFVKNTAPSGSGIDSGTEIDLDASTPEKLVFTFGYHHMSDGMYAGWTEHTCIVRASLAYGFYVRITGRDRNQVKDYLHDVYSSWLSEEYHAD